MTEKNNRKTIHAWCMYDWANSVYSLTITSSIFPAYYQAVTKNTANGNLISFFGYQIANSVLYTYALSFAFFLVVISGPVLGGVADFYGKKKFFMKLFCTLGSAACLGLFFFTSENVEWGIFMLILATVGYAGSLVFYNAFLPEITSSDTMDKVSAKGFTYGYIGSVVLLIINIAMIFGEEAYFPKYHLAARISFLMVGIWWFAFAQYTFRHLPETRKEHISSSSSLSMGWIELKKVLEQVRYLPVLKHFLLAFFLYSMGVQTVMYVATLFGEKEFHLETGQLITVVLLLQLIAIPGANIAAWLSSKKGNLYSLVVIICIWIFICFAAYFMQTGTHFYLLAIGVGLVMGGTQALSRSTYAKFIPSDTTDHTSFFSFYDVTEKLSIVLGTFTYGFIEQLTGSMRNSILALGIFFIAGLFFMYLTHLSKSKIDAEVSR